MKSNRTLEDFHKDFEKAIIAEYRILFPNGIPEKESYYFYQFLKRCK
jgi:hypothetical protein